MKMKGLVIFAAVLIVAAAGFGSVDYAVNVWISTTGTNVTYSMGKGTASLGELRTAVERVAAIAPRQIVHVIADERTSMASLFAVGKAIREGGLTNIVVSVFCPAHPASQSNGVERFTGMTLDVHDFELQEIRGVHRNGEPHR